MYIEQIKQVLQYGDLNTKDKDILTKAWLDTLPWYERDDVLSVVRGEIFSNHTSSYCPFTQSDMAHDAITSVDKDYFIVLYTVILFRMMKERLDVK